MAGLKAMQRIERVVTAVKRAEMGRLGLALARVEAERREAERLRTIAAHQPPPADVFEMAAQDRWRDLLSHRARAADARAAAAQAEADRHRAALGLALGREAALTALMERSRSAEARVVQRREDDWVQPRG